MECEDPRGPASAAAKQPARGQVDARVGGADHREEAAHDAQPTCVLTLRGRSGPLDGNLRSRDVVTAAFEMIDEVVQEARVGPHGEAECASELDVGPQVLTPSLAGHRAPPGHGRAIVASVSRSSLA